MSLSFMVTKGKIPLNALKSAVKSGKIKHGKYLEGGKHISDKLAFAMHYSPRGVVWAESDGKGGTMFTEYAGSSGSIDDLMKLFEELEKKYNCKIWDEIAISEGVPDYEESKSKRAPDTPVYSSAFDKNIELPHVTERMKISPKMKTVVPTKSKIRTGSNTSELFSAMSSGMLWKR